MVPDPEFPTVKYPNPEEGKSALVSRDKFVMANFIIINNNFRAQSQTNIRMSRGTGLFRVASQGLCRPFSKTFVVNIPDPTDRPWVSKDGEIYACRNMFRWESLA